MVTGSKGFIGGEVVKLLDSLDVEVVPYDLSDGHDILHSGMLALEMRGCDAVIHLAGVLGTHELFETPERAVEVNIVGSMNVMKACMVNETQYTGISMPPVFPSIYTATKIATLRLADAFHHSMGLRCAHVRAFNAYGPGQAFGLGHPQKILPTFAVAAWRREPLPVWGEGTQGVDLIHTEDLAKILVWATSCYDNKTFDGGSGRSRRVIDVAMEVCNITGWDPVIQFLPMRRGEEPTRIVAKRENWDYMPGSLWPRRRDLEETVMWYKDKV
jgi:UDP-glucose 4-epimerase